MYHTKILDITRQNIFPHLNKTKSASLLSWFKKKDVKDGGIDKVVLESKIGIKKQEKIEQDVTETGFKYLKRELPFTNHFVPPRQAWVLNMDTVADNAVSIIDLHPKIFGERFRVDIVADNIRWQKLYKHVSFRHLPVVPEVKRSNRKPWPQKGTGRARHGTRRSIIFLGGGRCHGPRDPKTYFYMLPPSKRIYGLCTTLSIKLAQDDLFIVKNLEIPTADPKYMKDLIKARNWGPSILFVDVDDMMPKNISLATHEIRYMNLMPLYGLNVFSMLKYETLVLTLAAVEKLEEKLLLQLNGPLSVRKQMAPFTHDQMY